MRVTSLFSILLVVAMCLWVSACTTPSPEKKDTTTKTDEVEKPAPPPSTTGSTGQSETSVVGGEKVAGVKNPPAIMALFKEDTTWPPASITAEEKATLNKAIVVLETSKGIIKITVFPDAAPLHSANFVKLAREGFYNGILFHRVIKGFMSQGGDPTGTGMGGPTPDYTIPAEIGLPHEAGSIAAARTGGPQNPQKRSSGSQFYMCHSAEGCASLNGDYTVFGKIIEGQDVNLALTVTYSNQGPIPGAKPDKIVNAWVELMP